MDNVLEYADIQQIISSYNYDTFLSEEPYQLLKEIEDELTRMRVMTAMREKAMKCGMKAGMFDTMAKAALRDKKTEEAEARKREKQEKKESAEAEARDAGGPLVGLSDMLNGTPNFGKYICTNKSVSYIGYYGEPVIVCNHPLFPTGRSVNIEDGSEMLDVSYKLDNHWRTRENVDRGTLSQSRTISALSRFGMDITSENAREVVSYMAEMDHLNRDIIPRKETVSRLGWIQSRGFSPYIEGVQYHTAENERFDEAYAAVHEHGSFETWKETAGKVMGDKAFMPARLAMAASVASVLLKWTCNQPFIVHLWSSESGTGKSIALMLAGSLWADPEIGKYIRSMNATKVANEQMASFCNNLPLILDELQTIQKRSDFDEMIYMLGEGTGRARGAKEGGLRKQTRWLNTTITSGEEPITADSRAGAVNRVISIETSGHVIPGDKVQMGTFADTLRDNYGFAGKMIVDRILKVKDFGNTIRDTYRHIVERLVQSVTGKQANYGAALLVGDALLNAIVFGGQYPQLTTDDIVPYLATQEMVDTNVKVRDWLVSYVAANASRFRQPDDTDNTEIRGDLIGKICQNGDVLIIKGVLKEQLQKHNWTMPSFLRWCHQRKLLYTNHTDTNRHWEVYEPIQGLRASVPVIHFLADTFKGQKPEDGYQVADVPLPF